MTEHEETLAFDAGQTVVLNALVDLFADETVVLSGDAEQRLLEVVESVTSPQERTTARDEFDRLSNLQLGESARLTPQLFQFVSDVCEGLEEDDYSISVTHEYHQSVSPLDAHLYTILHTHDVGRLRQLELTPAVENSLTEGIELLDDEAVEQACVYFSKAVKLATNHSEEMVSRVLASWGYFRAGDDETALDHVRSTLSLNDPPFSAKIVEATIDKNRGEHEAIRSGVKSVGIVLRWVVAGSEKTSTQAEIGTPSECGDVRWSHVHHVGGHAFVNRLYPDTWLRFKITGELPDFPRFQTYYMGIGLYDTEAEFIEKIYERFGSGPHRPDTVEQIHIHR